jgi:glyoxylate/hydroxypyruvate reductase
LRFDGGASSRQRHVTILLATRISTDEQARWLGLLKTALPNEHFVTARDAASDHQIDVAIVANPAPAALRNLPNLRFIQSLWAGVEVLLDDATIPKEIPLARMVDPAMNTAMAETALWAVLSLHRGYFECAAQQAQRRWQSVPQPRADEVRVAILGVGQMGRATATRLVQNGYRVTGFGLNAALEGVDTRQSAITTLMQVLADADIIINLLPLTPATRGILNAQAFAQMHNGASLVNLARGAHVVDADLLAALNSGHLKRAVLDVFHTEPLPTDHPFWTHPQVTVLPHVAAQTDPRSAVEVVARNVIAHRTGGQKQHLVNRQAGY